MKRILAIFSALLISAGIRAQNSNAQKETAKPPINTNTPVKEASSPDIKKVVGKNSAPAVTYKDATIKRPDIKKADIKRADIKKAPVAEYKQSPVKP